MALNNNEVEINRVAINCDASPEEIQDYYKTFGHLRKIGGIDVYLESNPATSKESKLGFINIFTDSGIGHGFNMPIKDMLAKAPEILKAIQEIPDKSN